MASSVLDIAMAMILSLAGIAMRSLPLSIVLATVAGAATLAGALDFVKVPAFGRLAIT